MNRLTLRIPVAALLLGAAIAAAPRPALAGESREARDDYKRDFSKTLPVKPGQRLDIDHSQGKLRITTHSAPELRIQARIEVSTSATGEAKTFGDAIAITVEESGGAIVVRSKYPEKKWHFVDKGFVSYSVDFDIAMPETMPLAARNKFGDISVENLKANSEPLERQRQDRVSQRQGRAAHRELLRRDRPDGQRRIGRRQRRQRQRVRGGRPGRGADPQPLRQGDRVADPGQADDLGLERRGHRERRERDRSR